jgi:protein O-GlcNAc transferase
MRRHGRGDFYGAARFKAGQQMVRPGNVAAPQPAAALLQQGLAFHQAGQLAEAEAVYQQVQRTSPNRFDVLILLAFIHFQRADYHGSIRHIDRALRLRPDSAEAFFNRGLALQKLERFDDAVANYDRAAALKPDYAEALYNRGHALIELDRLDEALASYDRAAALKPGYADAFNNRGNTLTKLNHLDAAVASYDRAIALKPDYAEAFSNRGNALKGLKRFDEALASYSRALALRPDYAEAFNNRGNALQSLARHEDAVADFERVRNINPDLAYVQGQLLHSKMHYCDWRSLASDLERVTSDVRARKRAIIPFYLMGVCGTAADQLLCSRIWMRDKCPPSPAPVWKGERYRHDRIRVAYLSADYRDHPVSQMMAGLFEQHDRACFEVFAFSFGPDSPSEMRTRIEGAFDRFIDVRGMSERAVAELLRGLEVDIAVDLMGFTQDARFGIFALRPAPVQVNYLGYPGTMGADYIDYIIADRFIIPFEHQAYYTEKVVYLPDTYQANSLTRPIGERVLTRADVGLPDDALVFCSFSSSYKITPAMFDIWMRLLRSVEGSVLWLLVGNAGAERNLRREAADRGIAADRLVFAPRAGYSDYLARYQLAHLFLDTLPFNAGTTASDALWAGLPLVTCAGEAYASRMAGSLLNAVGLPELVTHNLEDYEALALKLASDSNMLAGAKARLVANRATYPLFDSDRFRRHIEAAYKTMWDIYQRGEQPASFAIEPDKEKAFRSV